MTIVTVVLSAGFRVLLWDYSVKGLLTSIGHRAECSVRRCDENGFPWQWFFRPRLSSGLGFAYPKGRRSASNYWPAPLRPQESRTARDLSVNSVSCLGREIAPRCVLRYLPGTAGPS